MNQKYSTLNYFAILSIFLFSGAGTLMNAAVQTMIEAWPQIPVSTVRMVVSLPPLVSLPVMLFIGGIVGKKISYRACAILGTLLIALGGIAPYFIYSSWTLVLVFRALLGVGVGFLGMRNPLIIMEVPQEKQAAYIGYGSVLMNVGNVIANPIVGTLTQYSWRHPFLFDGLALLPVIFMVLFLKEPEVQAPAAEEDTSAVKEKASFSWRIYYYIAMQLVTTAVLYPLLSGLGTYMADKQIGTPVLVGTILSVYTGAGAVANMLLGKIMGIFKKYTIAVMCAMVTVGTALVLFVPSIPTIVLGIVLAGSGFNILLSVFQVYNGRVAAPSVMALGSTVILAMLQLGIFASTYFITVCHGIFNLSTDVQSAYMGCMICYAVMAVIAFVVKVAPEEDYK